MTLGIILTFEEWLDEQEGYSSRWERFLDDLREPIVVSEVVKWLESAYNEGYSHCYETFEVFK